MKWNEIGSSTPDTTVSIPQRLRIHSANNGLTPHTDSSTPSMTASPPDNDIPPTRTTMSPSDILSVSHVLPLTGPHKPQATFSTGRISTTLASSSHIRHSASPRTTMKGLSANINTNRLSSCRTHSSHTPTTNWCFTLLWAKLSCHKYKKVTIITEESYSYNHIISLHCSYRATILNDKTFKIRRSVQISIRHIYA